MTISKQQQQRKIEYLKDTIMMRMQPEKLYLSRTIIKELRDIKHCINRDIYIALRELRTEKKIKSDKLLKRNLIYWK